MKLLSIIFDLDGTLLDTLVDLAETCNEVLAHNHFPIHPTGDYKEFIGNGLQILMKRITPVGTEEIVLEQCCKLFTEQYSQNWKRNSCPYKGINDMLTALKSHGVKLIIAYRTRVGLHPPWVTQPRRCCVKSASVKKTSKHCLTMVLPPSPVSNHGRIEIIDAHATTKRGN